ncbi:hypothetical protein P4H66_19560 [Paenibacillus dokdonensis]|uniref:Uncharacterized protein n=1 Tax=Paenibacillus dokdonensis TaxID=2567944 RepID=A0ABU6GQK4_9BACL|nr:hypothetical protein [Paenibacillus dokdonensis]MEC0242004.1 hypothetical protein [Paenibacillus dokdonensis]
MNKDNAKIEVVGGQMNYSKLNTKVEPRIYAIGKAHIWLDLINQRMKPKKWNKATAKGTKVTFDMITKPEILELAFDELEVYLKQVNREHGTDIELNRNVSKEASRG